MDSRYGASAVKTFMNLSLLMHDTWDAHKMGDGDRLFRNAKLEMLMFGNTGHPKYKLAMFRMLLTEKLLSPQAAYEYRWNCTSNIIGGIGNNLANDNLVEIIVKKVKKCLHAQGANVTYASAHTAALACQVVDDIKDNLTRELDHHTGSSGVAYSTSVDVKLMTSELESSEYFRGHSTTFGSLKDPIESTDMVALNKWINEKKCTYMTLFNK